MIRKMPSKGVVVLSGAASGIGRAAAEALSRKSRTLALVDVNAPALGRVAEMCGKHSPAAAFPCDVTNASAVSATYQKIRAEFGAASVMINCAGIGRFAPFLEIDPEEWQRMFAVNVMGAVYFTRAVLPDMLLAGDGLIINIGSRMALDPHPATTAYAATKGALHGFSKALAMEVKGRGIKVTYLAPGGAKTNLATPKYEGYLDPAAIADAIVYVSENAGNIWVRDLVVLPLEF
jgi:NAD(P)-dependent dehydrogenase (short-subunit alcohol dehydrogenase family)